MSKRVLAALGAALLLVSCGGGSSSAPSRGDQTFSRSDAQSVNRDMARTTATRAANSRPAFGSVTQSSNRDEGTGITEDAASTLFDGNNVRLTVRRNDDTELVLDGATHLDDRESGTSDIPGHSAFRRDELFTHTDASFSVAALYISWDSADPRDYLAGGYWMHVVGDIDSQTFTRTEIGAFVDGPELAGAPTLPNLGTATYTGSAAGLYAYRFGATRDGVPVGTVEIGEFEADASFTANFDTDTISGCLGCNEGVLVSGTGIAPNGETEDFFDEEVQVEMRLGPTSIGSDGSFRGTDVSMDVVGSTGTRTDGSWGGRFSTIPDADDNPRVVAGTAGADWQEDDGSQGTFVGAWFGTTAP